jgi:hypothetical protein
VRRKFRTRSTCFRAGAFRVVRGVLCPVRCCALRASGFERGGPLHLLYPG